jgi:hypothetical protein
MISDIKKYRQIVEAAARSQPPLTEVEAPQPTKPIPANKLHKIVVAEDENEEGDLLVFENRTAMNQFVGLLHSSGYGAAYGGYTITEYDLELVEQTEGYEEWLNAGGKAVSLKYTNYVGKLPYNEEEIADHFNVEVLSDAYIHLTQRDWNLVKS